MVHIIGSVPVIHIIGSVPVIHIFGSVPVIHIIGSVPVMHIIGSVPVIHIIVFSRPFHPSHVSRGLSSVDFVRGYQVWVRIRHPSAPTGQKLDRKIRTIC